MKLAQRSRLRASISPISSLKTSSAGRPSISITTFFCAVVATWAGPIGAQPWLRPAISVMEEPIQAPEAPPSLTSPAICTIGPREEARPPTR